MKVVSSNIPKNSSKKGNSQKTATIYNENVLGFAILSINDYSCFQMQLLQKSCHIIKFMFCNNFI